ncbi:MAG TPA: hypothetical protein VM715_06950, partial [Candidatus Acidoferrum sp.]|nr:hypothetical protein [Candidatus Acidoferrum sp.]
MPFNVIICDAFKVALIGRLKCLFNIKIVISGIYPTSTPEYALSDARMSPVNWYTEGPHRVHKF